MNIQQFRIENLPHSLHILTQIFKENDAELHLVGGCVRDILLTKSIAERDQDFDLATDLNIDDISSILQQYGIKMYDVGKSKSFESAVINMDFDYEITTFRTETEGRHPEVNTNVSIEQDSTRRDFTINALYYDLINKQLIDFHNGFEDLENRVIRCVGNPQDRFNEDQLRKIRAIRFESKLEKYGFELSDDIIQTIEQNPSLDRVATERIIDEFYKVPKGKVIDFLKDCRMHELFSKMFPIEIDNSKPTRLIPFSLELSHSQYLATIFYQLLDEYFIKHTVTKKLPKKIMKEVGNRFGLSKDFVKAMCAVYEVVENEINNPFILKDFIDTCDILTYDFIRNCVGLNPEPKKSTYYKALTLKYYQLTTDGDEIRKHVSVAKMVGDEITKIETEKFNKLYETIEKVY